MTSLNLPLLRGKCLIQHYFKGVFALFWSLFLLHPEFDSLELHEGSDLTFQLISSSENLTPPPWTIRNWNIYIYTFFLYLIYQPILVKWVLFRSPCFLCHQGFLPPPYVSTFHHPGLVGRCLGRGRTLAPLRGGSRCKKNLVHSGYMIFFFLYERNPMNQGKIGCTHGIYSVLQGFLETITHKYH